MTVTLSRLYDDPQAAHRAVMDLEAAGIRSDDISLVASNADNWYRGDKKTTRKVDRDHDGVDDRAEGAGAGAGIGAVLGGTAGLLAGLGIMAIPGLGPVVAAGWLAATADRSRSRWRRGRHHRRLDASWRAEGRGRAVCRRRSPWRNAGDRASAGWRSRTR